MEFNDGSTTHTHTLYEVQFVNYFYYRKYLYLKYKAIGVRFPRSGCIIVAGTVNSARMKSIASSVYNRFMCDSYLKVFSLVGGQLVGPSPREQDWTVVDFANLLYVCACKCTYYSARV